MRKSLLIAYGLLLFAAIGSYALLGWHSRMIADDYCLAAVGLTSGPLGSVAYFYRTWNGLYALSFISGLSAWMLPGLLQVQTLLLIALLAAGLGALLSVAGWPKRRIQLSSTAFILLVMLLVLIILYTVPSFRNLYWYSVLFQNTLQVAWLMLGLSATLILLRPSIQLWQRRISVVGLMILTFVFVGSANTFFLPLVGGLLLAGIYAVWRLEGKQQRIALWMIGMVGAAASVAFVLVFTAPGNAVRQAQVLELTGHAAPSIFQLIPMAFALLWEYLVFPHTLLYAGLAFLVGIVVTLALGEEDTRRIAHFPLSERWAWADALALLALSAGVTLATVATTAYGVGSLVWHTMFLPRVVQALCMVALGYMLTVWLARRGFPSVQIKRRPAYRAVRLALIGLMIALPVGALATNLSRLPDFQAYAHDWDQVHAMILAEVAAGNRGVIEVPPYRYSLAAFLYLDEIDQPDGFTRRCAAGFYGVEDILMPPILEPPRLGYRPLSQP